MKRYDGKSFNGCTFVKEIAPIVSLAGNKRRVAEWRCECGAQFTASIGNVTSGQIKSCGCKKRASTIARSTKHGHSPLAGGTKLYRFWQSMKDRCENQNSYNFFRYGGRGIKMHGPWRNSFERFRAWFNRYFGLDDVPPGLTMDRRNNNGNYEPENLRLATMKTQANNKRNNHIVIYNGQRMTVAELAEQIGMNQKTLGARLNRGVQLEKAIL